MSVLTRISNFFRFSSGKQSSGPARRGDSGPSQINHDQKRSVYTQLGFRTVRVAAEDGRFSSGGSGDSHLQFDRIHLQNQQREFNRNNPLCQGMIDRAASYIVGSGFNLQSKTGDKELDAAYEAYWKAWWEEPEISGLLSGHQVEKQFAKELLSMGDFGVLKLKSGKIQIVESEQICGRSLKDDGLVRDKNGAITGFWVAEYVNGQVQVSAARQIGRDGFLFAVQTDRPSSKRGFPPLQAAFAMLHRINDVCDAEALAWQTLARLTLIINKEDAGAVALQTSDEDESKAGSQEPDVTTRVQDFATGTSFWGKPGEKVSGVERNIPGANFPQSITMFLRLLGLPLGLPLEITSLDWTKSNYSQCRAVLQQAFQTFIGWQALLEKRIYRPLFQWCIARGIKNGDLQAPADQTLLFKHEWLKPTFPWIDQLQESKAWGEMVDRGFATYSQVLKSRDKDREEVLAELKQETLDAIRIVDEIEGETGRKLDYRNYCGRSASVNGGGGELVEDGGTEEDAEQPAKDGKKPPAPPKKKAAQAGAPVPPINLIVRMPAPTKKTSTITRASGARETVEQELEYPPEVA